MEPPANQPTSASTEIPGAPGPKRSRWPFSAKVTGIGAGILLVIIVLASLVLSHHKKAPAQDALDDLKPGTITGPYIERENYPRKEIGSSIADATAMQLNKSSDAVKTTKGTVIMPACTVITQSDLRDNGLLPQANPNPVGITMSYIDGSGSGTIPFGSSGVPRFNNSNECRYSLQKDLSSVTLDVYQPYLVSEHAIQDELGRLYDKAPAISGVSGVDLYQRKARESASASDANVTEYFVRQGTDVSFYLRVDYKTDRQVKVEALIKTALHNISQLATAPQGAPHPTYKNSPTYKQTYLRACSLLDDDGMKALASVPAAAFLTESISNSTGVTQFPKRNDQTLYVYVQNECERDGVGGGVSGDSSGLYNASPKMQITTTSYNDIKAARNEMDSTKQGYKEILQVPGIGDQAVVVRNSVGENQLIMRKDRFIISLTYDTLGQKNHGIDDQTKYAAALQPFAKYIVSRIEKL